MLLSILVTFMLFWDVGRIRLSVQGSPCPAECMCRWKTGKETVECTSRGLVTIPAGIDTGTQVLDLSGNNLQNLPKDTFMSVKLLNLQRIYLSNCNIGHINEGAFSRLTNLVELDLSHNLLVSIPSATFKDVPELRRLILSNNPIQRIDNNAFVSLIASLNTLELSRCQLESIAPKAFHGLKGLINLKLDNNRLSTLSGKSIQPLKNLHSVDLHGNPWRCDCSMQDVKLWITRYNIPYNVPPTCSLPKRLSGLSLDELETEDLACQPQSMYSNRRLEVSVGNNASLICEVAANPSPDMQWLRNGYVVANLSRFNQGLQVYVIFERGGTEKSSILTISSVTEEDAGDYVCVAENKAGRFSANFTLEVNTRDLEASGLTSGQIAGISVGLILIGAIVSLLICILLAKWRQTEREEVKHPPLNQSQHKLMNSINHVDYKGKSNKSNSVRMSFSFPRLSRSSSAQRNYSDEASDSDRTLIDNSASPSKSSNCNLSTNKPDVVNVERNPPETNLRSKRDKDSRKKEKKQDKKQKDKRKDRHRWKCDDQVSKEDVDDSKIRRPSSPNEPSEVVVVDNRCNSIMGSGHSLHNHHTTLPRSHSKHNDDDHGEKLDKKKTVIVDDDDDNRYGSYGNLKLSSSSEWNKITSEMIENAAFTRDNDVGLARENYELLEKKWGIGGINEDYKTATGSDTRPPSQALPLPPQPQPPPPPSVTSNVIVDDGADNKGGSKTLTRNSTSTRFRHYVPVLPPLPAQHYSQVRNSLIRTCKDEDITDM